MTWITLVIQILMGQGKVSRSNIVAVLSVLAGLGMLTGKLTEQQAGALTQVVPRAQETEQQAQAANAAEVVGQPAPGSYVQLPSPEEQAVHELMDLVKIGLGGAGVIFGSGLAALRAAVGKGHKPQTPSV